MPGYDELFDTGMNHLALKTSTLSKPKLWPSNVSSMRKYTSYEGQSESSDPHPSSWHSDYMVNRAHNPIARQVATMPRHGAGTLQARLARARARAVYQARLNQAARAHTAQNVRAAKMRSTGMAAPIAPHVTDSRRWAWSEQRS